MFLLAVSSSTSGTWHFSFDKDTLTETQEKVHIRLEKVFWQYHLNSFLPGQQSNLNSHLTNLKGEFHQRC